MQSANVTTIDSLYAAFRDRDIPTVVSLVDGGIVVTQTDLLPWGGRYTGLMGLQGFFSKLTQAITSEVTIEGYIEAGDRVVAIGRTHGHVNATKVAFDVLVAHVWTLRGGRAVGFDAYIDRPTMLDVLNAQA